VNRFARVNRIDFTFKDLEVFLLETAQIDIYTVIEICLARGQDFFSEGFLKKKLFYQGIFF